MAHKLSLEIPTVLNSCIFKIFDTSVYDALVPVTCPILSITPPGFGYSIELPFTPGGSTVITACDIDLQTTDCGTVFNSIPDGIYIVKYSVSPNEQVFVEYNHLRITIALNRISKILCELDLAACEPDAKVSAKLDQIHKIRTYLDAAKAKVEYCHEPEKGMTLYNYAIKLLNKLECINC